MCDFMSYIEKGSHLYYLTDEMISSLFPDRNFVDCIGHHTITEYFGYAEVAGGTHHEGVYKLPKEIAFLINEGRMNKMALAADPSYSHLQYDSEGFLQYGYAQYDGDDRPHKIVSYMCRGTTHADYLAALETFFTTPEGEDLLVTYPAAAGDFATILNGIMDGTYVDRNADIYKDEIDKMGYISARNAFTWTQASEFLNRETGYFTHITNLLNHYGL